MSRRRRATIVTDDQALIRAILESPEEDLPRLAFADWLDGHGRTDQAEVIRVRYALRTLPADDPTRAGLEQREMGLSAWHQHTWVEQCGIGLTWGQALDLFRWRL